MSSRPLLPMERSPTQDFSPLLANSPPSPPPPSSIRKQELPPHLGGRPLLPLIPPPQCSTSPPSLRSPTSELRDSIFQSQNHLRAIAGQELDNEQDSKGSLQDRLKSRGTSLFQPYLDVDSKSVDP